MKPTADDIAIYEQLTGFTDHDIEIIARAVGVDEEKVYRMVDCIRFIKKQGLSAERSAGAAPLDVAVLREAMHNEKWCKNEWLHERIHDPDADTIHTLEELAAEYARLAGRTDR